MMDINRWKIFERRQQILMIGSEIMRAKVWQYRDEDKFRAALERGLSLLDLTLSDQKWRNGLAMLLFLRQEMAAFYIGQHTKSIAPLYRAL